ncbi:MAG: ATPase [Chlorobiaceae bacterium]|nr:ATPase [Chlorobiaceae bacterium]MBA4308719.1 ATPase [Chlorobiaceae bacterium]
MRTWHNAEVDKVIDVLKTTNNGLQSNDAQNRLTEYGYNELVEKKKKSMFLFFLDQFNNLVIIILIIAAIISGFLGKDIEAISIITIVILAAVLGFIQEYQASKAIDSLKKMAAPNATVLRDGETKIIPSRELVPGDVVLLKAGDKIPADSRLIDVSNLKVDEAALTGESLPVEKTKIIFENENLPIGDRKNLVFMGTSVSYGRAKAVVTETGMKSEFGKIATLLQETGINKTPLMKNLDSLGKVLGIIAIAVAALMSIIGVLKGYEIVTMFVWGVAIAVAVIPEALPAVVTISLALGVKRMVKRRALIRKLPAVETLGATQIICSDKTGTLTKDEMTIRKIFYPNKVIDVTGIGYAPEGDFFEGTNKLNIREDARLQRLLEYGALCNDAKLIKDEENVWDILGDPTEGSITVTAAKAKINIDEVQNLHPRTNEIPFSSETKRMTTIHKYDKNFISISKGAPEIILNSSTHYRNNGNIFELDENTKKHFYEVYDQFATQALRVIAISSKELISDSELAVAEVGMVFEGLFGMIDPPRDEVKAAIKTCEEAGIKPIMITGDHKITAVAIAKELGIMKDGLAYSGSEVEQMTDAELDIAVTKTDVFARIAPAHKLKIVNSLMNQGKVVAMTGDGVNDAPALKRADIGVAMGITGTDVSKEASDMILTDDNFASIIAAVEEGRSIFENIRKYIIFLLSGNMGTVLSLIVILLLGLPKPLLAVNILFINFIMDGLIAIAIGVAPPEPGIMKRKPRNVSEGIFNRESLIFTLIAGTVIASACLAIFMVLLPSDFQGQEANSFILTMFFVTLILARIFNSLNCSSINDSIFKKGVLSNKYLFLGISASLLLTILIVYVPFLNTVFSTSPLTLENWLMAAGFAFSVVIVMEIRKAIIKIK